MHKAPAVREAKPAVSLTLTKKGNVSIRVTGRKPAYIMQSEFLALSRAHNIRQNVLFLLCKKKKILVTRGTEVTLNLSGKAAKK